MTLMERDTLDATRLEQIQRCNTIIEPVEYIA